MLFNKTYSPYKPRALDGPAASGLHARGTNMHFIIIVKMATAAARRRAACELACKWIAGRLVGTPPRVRHEYIFIYTLLGTDAYFTGLPGGSTRLSLPWWLLSPVASGRASFMHRLLK